MTSTGRNAVMPGEQNPEFPGGEKACMAFLSKNIHYPPVCVSEEASGRVYVQFVVEKDGEIGQIRVLRSPHPYLAQEARFICSPFIYFIPFLPFGIIVDRLCSWHKVSLRFRIFQ